MGQNASEIVPGAATRQRIGRRLAAASGELTTHALADMAARHPWYAELDADNRASIALVAQAGVSNFVRWFTTGDPADSPENIFAAAPRVLSRSLSLNQIVDLIRTVMESVRSSFGEFPDADRAPLETAMLHYSREIAFDIAEVYARAAEQRGAWDARVEALVMDAVIRGEADESVVARASGLGWGSPAGLAVAIGDLPGRSGAVDALRHAAVRAGIEVLAAPLGRQLAVLVGGDLNTDADGVALVARVVDYFADGPVVVGPVVRELSLAVTSARAALAGRRAVLAWPDAPRPVAASSLLPERALAGDGHARRELANALYAPLAEHAGDLLATAEAWFAESGSVEGTARRLFVHPNTVRYRLARIEEVTGYSLQDSRDAYALRLALSLGRLLG